MDGESPDSRIFTARLFARRGTEQDKSRCARTVTRLGCDLCTSCSAAWARIRRALRLRRVRPAEPYRFVGTERSGQKIAAFASTYHSKFDGEKAQLTAIVGTGDAVV